MLVTLIPGSGVGPQIAGVVRDVVARLGADVQWDEQEEISAAIESVRRTGLALKGRWIAPIEAGKLPPTVAYRKALGISTLVRRVKNVPGLPARGQNIDMVIFREASEDIYSGFEHQSAEGVYETVKVTTRAACERIHRTAFEWARANRRKRVTTVHKANILKKADGMFLAVGREVATDFPDLSHDDVIVDALCMQIVRKPHAFDVLVAGNLFGDIVSDCAAGMAGGVTVAVGVGHGPGVKVYESPHAASMEAVGADGGNPYPMILLMADLLGDAGQIEAAARLRRACEAALLAGHHTPDMGGSSGCSAVREAILAAI
ncbi:isocitrate dehydrogenase [Deltaproteobacteria bacterium]|nr:isocitrate dehydrogenase [Deltaproteobacteria bacterium]